jgi:hypothetical protein
MDINKHKQTYYGLEIPKNQMAIIRFLQSGSNDITKAYSMSNKKVQGVKSYIFYASWFNNQLKRLHARGLFFEIPYVYKGIMWINPGVNGSKANFQAITLHDANMEFKRELNKIV